MYDLQTAVEHSKVICSIVHKEGQRERGSCNIETLSLGIEAGWDKCAAISGQFPISSAVYTALQTVLTPTLRNSGNEYVNRCNM